MLNTHYRIVS